MKKLIFLCSINNWDSDSTWKRTQRWREPGFVNVKNEMMDQAGVQMDTHVPENLDQWEGKRSVKSFTYIFFFNSSWNASLAKFLLDCSMRKWSSRSSQEGKEHICQHVVCAQALKLGNGRSRCMRFTSIVTPEWLKEVTNTLNINALDA